MFKQTLCFIKRQDEILMLNREKAPTKGLWNGVGGKMEQGETPLECVIREVKEETGIDITKNQTKYKGVITWEVDKIHFGGLYVFLVDIHNDFIYQTPKMVDEGILDWKRISWLFGEKNFGEGEMLPHFLPTILNNSSVLEHKCTLENNRLMGYEFKKIELVEEIK
ncbi:NUDIX hydrolase [Alkalihalobacillus pseudalcaliphilus]|uniref:NUDIX hydrolase n=1 Tax=Alkalihalobacillus pseudalcaliphilus TaxID=79884 RepID=UPI00064D95B1|nr:8-oxo-dGTP diphosphatase [Alkalihalobacillus pseudalcaliphilus]KMK78064.1 DNA mismatch repair protein MutT [Alkalihalobacillus pseudalcaliphilus]